MGTISHENYTFSLGFSRADASSPDTTRDVVLYGAHVPISGRTDSRVAAPYQEKRTLPGTHASVSEFVCVAALGAEAPISVSRFGNINPIPFRTTGATRASPRFRTAFAYPLGSTDPCSTAVHMEPFSTSAFKVSCYTLLSGFRLPWPPSCCLYQPTPFVGSDERLVGRLNPAFGSSRIASPAYQEWPTWHSHSTPGSN
ncbi:unnamed protein product [Clavelina lepadiformis]|uniref:Uncharacterized protein n=1 Tax=Clavelina lepadiformis TaxID=159417 RepID=A0ABP0GNP6_CLALP